MTVFPATNIYEYVSSLVGFSPNGGLVVLTRQIRCDSIRDPIRSDTHSRPSLMSIATGPALLKRTSKFTSRPNESSDMTSGSTDELWAKMLFG